MIDRVWSDGDSISYTLGAALRLTKYRGLNEIDDLDRFGLEYGPVLLSYLGPLTNAKVQVSGVKVAWIPTSPANLLATLQPVANSPLRFTIGGDATKLFAPYYQVQTEPFSCYPVVKAP